MLDQSVDRGPVAAPGAFNALVGKAIARAGFPACYISGGATSVAAGVPDVGLLTLDHFASLIREVARASTLPVLADADTGFGEEEMVRRTVIEYAHSGAAGLHLEDQIFPKRCGHLDGKACIPMEQAASRIGWAARAAREHGDGSTIICARTDAVGVEGFDAGVARAIAYVRAGAEMIFPEGLRSEAEFARFADAMRGVTGPSGRSPWMLANMSEFGKTPLIPLSRFGEFGYHIVIYPVSMLRVAMGAVTRALATLRDEGTVASLLDDMQSRDELYDLVGYKPGVAWDFPAG